MVTLIFSTAASRREARRLAGLLLDKRLAACVTIVPGLESHYRWKGKKEKGREVLLLIKTRAALYRACESLLRKHHSYSVPEILAIPVQKGSRAYLSWLFSETAG